MKTYSLQITAPLTARPRRLMRTGLVAAMIALTGIPLARAEDSAAPAALAAVPMAQAGVSREYLIKAAILYNFAKFAQWPAAAFGGDDAPLRVCVLGDDPFGAALDALHGKTVRARTLTTSRIATVDSAGRCHMLFVSTSERARLAEILAALADRPILTVADMGRFTDLGGIIAITESDNHSRIEINLGAARQAGVTLSSKLLRLADTADTSARSGVPRSASGAM